MFRIAVDAAAPVIARADPVVETVSGSSINTGIWTLVTLLVTTGGGILLAIIKQWGPWKQGDSEARAADFERLRAEIASLKTDHREAMDALHRRIEKLEQEVATARKAASEADQHAMKSDAKLSTALTACELLLGLVEREMPDAKEIGLVKRLLAQAASDDMGIGVGMRKIATLQGVGK